MSLNVASPYERTFYTVRDGRVDRDLSLQYGEFLDLCWSYGEENLYETEDAPEDIVVAYKLEGVMPYLRYGSDLRLRYDLEEKTIVVGFPRSIQICDGVMSDAMQFSLDREGGKEVAERLSGWLFAEKERKNEREVPFGRTIFPILYQLKTGNY